MLHAIANYKTDAMTGIFKTNIATPEERQQMIRAIHAHFDVATCYVDIEDCDKVLRITDMKVDEYTMMAFVRQQGFLCEILE
ncbi:MAG TPA: hypothetical protein VFS25_08140 [Chitinophaga sp.]|jgi:hypothetical protein|uniref:hypothetical protein n=1 Tax=Chitinophaga sp. TaxID=1869181 RepID=UPI002DB59F2E|nr:hypothetical protein [Chitinophaga sp.]HEU4552789.1 hypothetical protein [Chitinophaga sp.]